MTENQIHRDGEFVVPFSMQLMSGPNDECVRDEATAREAISFLFNLPMANIQVEVESAEGELVENGVTWLGPLDEGTARFVLAGNDFEATDEFSGYSVYVPGCPA